MLRYISEYCEILPKNLHIYRLFARFVLHFMMRMGGYYRFYDFCCKLVTTIVTLVFAFILTNCTPSKEGNDEVEFTEKEATTVEFTHADVIYIGDTSGEGYSDGWVIKLYTDMEIDDYGNLIGPGVVMQLALNAYPYQEQTPNLDYLEGIYRAQNNSGDFAPYTFVYGYIDYLDLPIGRIYRPDATFYASIAEGETSAEMEADLIDDGKINITRTTDGNYKIEGTVVGKQCRKRKFQWKGVIEPKSEVVQKVPNSTLTSSLTLTSFTQAFFRDKVDSFYLGDESYRTILVFLAEPNIYFDWGNPKGTGEILRIELLVPWSTDIATNGIPAGNYPMMVRNADTSIDKDSIVPFRSVPGLPNCFTVPKWSGAWYVRYADSGWSDSYARLDSGSVTVERGSDGSHRFICNFGDCSSPSYYITTDVTIKQENITIY